jgi:uncharacterized phage-associated protein
MMNAVLADFLDEAIQAWRQSPAINAVLAHFLGEAIQA